MSVAFAARLQFVIERYAPNTSHRFGTVGDAPGLGLLELTRRCAAVRGGNGGENDGSTHDDGSSSDESTEGEDEALAEAAAADMNARNTAEVAAPIEGVSGELAQVVGGSAAAVDDRTGRQESDADGG
eukprot:SAG11_NODE_15968_length_561_cov_0.755411_1_plen_127_part_01